MQKAPYSCDSSISFYLPIIQTFASSRETSLVFWWFKTRESAIYSIWKNFTYIRVVEKGMKSSKGTVRYKYWS